MDYFNKKLGRIQTEKELERWGVAMRQEVLDALGLHPLVYNTPSYDTALYSIAADGLPHESDSAQEYVQDFAVTPRELGAAKLAMKERVTARRWQAETGGVTITGFGRILTAIEDQNRIASALQGVTSAAIAEVDFKGADGWIKLTREMLTQVSIIIAEHVQACFSRERALHEAIDAAETVAALAALDIETNWPGSEAGVAA